MQVDVLQRHREGDQLVGRAQARVDGHRLGGRVGEGEQLGRREPVALDLADEAGDEGLLAFDAADVRAVADAVPEAYVVEGLLPGDGLLALLEEQAALCGAVGVEVLLVHVAGEAHVHPAHDVRQCREALEVDDDGVVHAQTGELLDRVLGAGGVALRRLAHRERRVEHRVGPRRRPGAVGKLARRDGQQGVARDGDGCRVFAVGVDVQQERRVGAADVVLAAASQRAVAVRARVRADDEDVPALGGAGLGTVLGQAVAVEGVDVAAELQIDPPQTGRAQHRHGQCGQERDPQRAAPAAPRCRGAAPGGFTAAGRIRPAPTAGRAGAIVRGGHWRVLIRPRPYGSYGGDD